MSNTLSHDAKLIGVESYKRENIATGNTLILCDPPLDKPLILKFDNPLYAKIYNCLIKDSVYKFEYEYSLRFETHHLLHVYEPSTYIITDMITGFLNLEIEYNIEMYQILFKNSRTRIVVFEKVYSDLELDTIYRISYKKYDIDNLYIVTDYQEMPGYLENF